MAQIVRKWLQDRCVNNKKIDDTDTYVMRGLQVDYPSAGVPCSIAVGLPITSAQEAIHVKRTTNAGIRLDSSRNYRLLSDTAGSLDIMDGSVTRLRINPNPKSTWIYEDATVTRNFEVKNDSSIVGTLTVPTIRSLSDFNLSYDRTGYVTSTGPFYFNTPTIYVSGNSQVLGNSLVNGTFYTQSGYIKSPISTLALSGPDANFQASYVNIDATNVALIPNAFAGGNVTAYGDTSVVAGATPGNLYVAGEIIVNGASSISGDTTISGNLQVLGDSSVNGNLTVATMIQSFDPAGISLSSFGGGGLSMSSFGGGMFITSYSGALNLQGDSVSITSPSLDIHSPLAVYGDATFSGDATIMGNLSIYSDPSATFVPNIYGEYGLYIETHNSGVLNLVGDGGVTISSNPSSNVEITAGYGANVEIQAGYGANFNLQGTNSFISDYGNLSISALSTLMTGDVTANNNLQVLGNITGDVTATNLLVLGDGSVNGAFYTQNGNIKSPSATLILAGPDLSSGYGSINLTNQNISIVPNPAFGVSGHTLIYGDTTISPGNLYVAGDTTVGGGLYVQRTITTPDLNADTLVINMTGNSMITAGDIVFEESAIGHSIATLPTVSGTNGTELTIKAGNAKVSSGGVGGNLILVPGLSQNGVTYDGAVVPVQTNAYDLGTTGLKWKKIWAVDLQTNALTTSALTVNGNILVNNMVIPQQTGTYSIVSGPPLAFTLHEESNVYLITGSGDVDVDGISYSYNFKFGTIITFVLPDSYNSLDSIVFKHKTVVGTGVHAFRINQSSLNSATLRNTTGYAKAISFVYDGTYWVQIGYTQN